MSQDIPINTIICGDSLEVMRDWPDGCVDLVLTDLPYGVGIGYDKFEDTKDNLYPLVREFCYEAKRIAKRVAAFCGNGNQWMYDPPDWTLAWFYTGGANYCSWGFNCWQPILVWGKDPKLTTKQGCWPDAFILNQTPDKYGHPCPKPLNVMQWLVSRTSNDDELIIDPFCGEGTTCVAAKMLGRRYIGIDISEEYCQIARERLESVDTGVPLKEARQGQMAMFEAKE
jgi:modification methylase